MKFYNKLVKYLTVSYLVLPAYCNGGDETAFTAGVAAGAIVGDKVGLSDIDIDLEKISSIYCPPNLQHLMVSIQASDKTMPLSGGQSNCYRLSNDEQKSLLVDFFDSLSQAYILQNEVLTAEEIETFVKIKK